MRILALDLSKASAGWACWSPKDQHVASGYWVLGTAMTSRGMTFRHLYQELNALHSLGKIDAVFYERPLDLGPQSGMKRADVAFTLTGLAMHCESWAEAARCRIIRDVNQASWRAHFLKDLPRPRKGEKISEKLKALAVRRCNELGFAVERHDQAEAIGILDYACMALDITPYWRAHEVLPLNGGGR